MEKRKTGIIFGKFYPAHNGHIWFIKRVALDVDKLYVVVCSETERDQKLFEESSMPVKPSVDDRIRFIKEEIHDVDNIDIIHMNEDGIESYPNGWLKWSERVEELLISKNVLVDTVFTNEKQDVENYKKYFYGKSCFTRDLKVCHVDFSRKMVSISSTKVRNNLILNWEYLPNSVKKYFLKHITDLLKLD